MYPAVLEIKDTTESTTFASYLDLLLSIGRDGQLHTSIYDKRDDFNFHITNFPFLSSLIPSSPAYGVFISQLIRYTRACSSYKCFILRARRPSSKLLNYFKTTYTALQISQTSKNIWKVLFKFRSNSQLLSKFGDISFQEYVTKEIYHPVFHGDLPQRRQGPDPRTLWLLVGTPSAFGPELACRLRVA